VKNSVVTTFAVVVASIASVGAVPPPVVQASSPYGCLATPAAPSTSSFAPLQITSAWVDTLSQSDGLHVQATFEVASLAADPAADIPAGAQSVAWMFDFKNNAQRYPGTVDWPYLRVFLAAGQPPAFEQGYLAADQTIRWVPATGGSFQAGSPGYIQINQNASPMSVADGDVLTDFRATATSTAAPSVEAVASQTPRNFDTEYRVGAASHDCLDLVPALGPAQQADSFVDSIGVNVHLTFAGNYQQYASVENLLQQLGVRHIRDGVPTTAASQAEVLRLAQSFGVTSDLIIPRPSSQSMSTIIGELDAVAPAMISIEGTNEPDNSPPEPGFPGSIQQQQQQLYAAAKADPTLAAIPVLGPSLANPPSYAQLGDLSQYLDQGSLHAYAFTNPHSRVDILDPDIALEQITAASKPIQVTETGWSTFPGGSSLSVDEYASGSYFPKSLLITFAAGIAHTYLYELLDEEPSQPGDLGYFGLARSDFSLKPSGVAVRNLISLLADPGPAFTPSPLQIAVSGLNVQHVLLQKRDGSYWLALWQDARLYTYEPAGGERIGPGDLQRASHTATITLGTAQQTTTYAVSHGTQPVAQGAASTIATVDVPSDDIVVVKMTAPPANGPMQTPGKGAGQGRGGHPSPAPAAPGLGVSPAPQGAPEAAGSPGLAGAQALGSRTEPPASGAGATALLVATGAALVALAVRRRLRRRTAVPVSARDPDCR
jgi:hypothetical protein